MEGGGGDCGGRTDNIHEAKFINNFKLSRVRVGDEWGMGSGERCLRRWCGTCYVCSTPSGVNNKLHACLTVTGENGG